MGCELCDSDGGLVVARNSLLRVVLPEEVGYPGFTRVIWNTHFAEMSELEPVHQHYLMRVVFDVEAMMCEIMLPDKVNLASLGNYVDHLHWHIIPRYADDPRFPDPVWGEAVRKADPARLAERRSRYQSALGLMTLPTPG